MFSLMMSDLRAKAAWMYDDTGRRSIVKALLTDGTGAMLLYRVMQWGRHHRLSIIEMIANRLNTIINGCIIGRGAEFGPEFVLVHAGGIVINGAVVGGARIVIEHQVTIGAEKRQSPRLGDDVFIGAGAKIVGGVRIGSEVRVGANAVVLSDVPDGCTAVGVPARIVTRAAAAS